MAKRYIADKFEGELFQQRVETTVNGIATPVTLASTAGSGTLAAGTYSHRISAFNEYGDTLASAETLFTLGATGGVINNWNPVTGATGYKIYGRTQGAELLIASVGLVTTYLDDGSITPSGALPLENTTGFFEVDYAAANVFVITMNVGTTFLEVNPPTGNLTRNITIYLSGNFTAVTPSSWNVNKIGRIKGNEISKIDLNYVSSGFIYNTITNSLTQYPSPFLSSTSPLSIQPNVTSVLTLKGDFFTPSTVVSLSGDNFVNLTTFIDSQTIQLSITAGALDGDFDITIDNGSSVTFVGALKIFLGEVTFPSSFDWQDIVGSSTRTETGDIKITDNDVQGIATWNKILDFSVAFELRFAVDISPFNPDQPDQTSLDFFELLDQSVTADIFTYIYKKDGNLESNRSSLSYLKNGSLITLALGALAQPPIKRFYKFDWNPTTETLLVFANTQASPDFADNVIQTLGTADGLSNTFTAKARFTVQRHDFVQIQHILKQ